MTPVKRALLSVSDKTGLVAFAKALAALGVDIISTGGTSQLLQQAGIAHQPVEAVTELAAMLDGRVKTLHPKIHGGILGRRDVHAEEAEQHGIEWIDLVVVNFYPFEQGVAQLGPADWEKVVELIDVGGPTMVRAAAKNFNWVGVVVNVGDYPSILTELKQQGGLSYQTKQQLAGKAFALTSQYDTAIHAYFQAVSKKTDASIYPVHLNLQFEKHQALRYGENPHQTACAYQLSGSQSGLLSALQHQGKPLSYNNILDAEAALTCVGEFTEPTCVIVKHANPCGVATAGEIEAAYQYAYHADALSAFGGIVALNRPCTQAMAEAISGIFMEVVLAPAYTREALAAFSAKPNLRVLEMSHSQLDRLEMKFITGGVLLQERDPQWMDVNAIKIVTKRQPERDDIEAMLFAWQVLKHIKSNGILIAKQNMTVGIGAGQVSRIDAVDLAVRKAGEKIHQSILASDAFFPFRDSIDRIANTGIRAVIQPGGSVRDDEVIAACNQHDIAMVFTGKRCFRH
ncbi:MAG: bifunctional phosphoribosylaminoimidazolecarboxamide formyltransferase/IMP cyclohydrolase [Gammaproteobacteria bacterium RIFCSPHIGHO2_12_FULL_45_12]|nr:MAG: bifunctional phosphoribosylaminoimidazolecarboxamide formyltransferase/IMP cyclohydrolase [Gammaproteobacteria bacterium RIFCSPHIGHO2_12_FULL_45_12]